MGTASTPPRPPAPETGHFGLTGMRERVQRLDCSLDVRSARGQGTTITSSVWD